LVIINKGGYFANIYKTYDHETTDSGIYIINKHGSLQQQDGNECREQGK